MIQKIVLFFLSLFDFFYQKKIITFLKKNKYHKFDLLIDVGAHKGESIDLFSKKYRKRVVKAKKGKGSFKRKKIN